MAAAKYDGAFFEYFCSKAADQLLDRADLPAVAAARGGPENVTIADVGAGTGYLSLAAARLVHGARVRNWWCGVQRGMATSD